MSNIINVQDLEKYPINYDDILSFSEQETILNYMNGMQSLAERYYNQGLSTVPTEQLVDSRYMKLYQHTLTSLTGAKNAYATLGIMVEYNWDFQHPATWTLATRADAENRVNKQDTVEEVNNAIEELLDYNDVGL